MEFPTLEHAIAHFAEATPDKVCLIEAESGYECTYSEFWNKVLVFSERLKGLGMEKGDRAVVRVTQKIDTLVAAFGIHMAGGINVPIAQKIGEERIKELLDYFEARFFIAVKPVEYKCDYIDINTVYDGSEKAYEGEVILPSPGDVSDIFFTTGTTGTPKGVMRSYEGYMLAHQGWADIMSFTSEDVFMACNSQNMIGEMAFLWRSVPIGASSIIGSGVVFLNDFLNSVGKYGVTSLSLRPAEVNILLGVESEFKKYCGGLRSVSIKSGATSIRDQKKLKELLPNTKIFLGYGATEAPSICGYDISSNNIAPFCIGTPRKGYSVRVVTEEGEEIKDSSYNNPGLIACKSIAVMSGYWRALEITNSILKEGWLILTDIGYADSEGLFYVLGRRDEVINTGGHKVSPHEIEELVLEDPDIKECACGMDSDEVLGSVPKLYVVMKEGCSFSASKIYNYLSHKLENYKLPRKIEQTDVLPKTENNMKIKRGALRG